MSGWRLAGAVVVALFAWSCAGATLEPESATSGPGLATMELNAGYREYGGFMPTTSRALAPREEGCPIDVLLVGTPERSYEVVGLVTAERVGQAIIEQGGGQEQVIGWLRETACHAGAHVMFDIRLGTDRSAYVGRALRGRAVVAVYTDGNAPAPAPPPPAPAAPPAPPEPPAPADDDGGGGGWGTPPAGGDEPAGPEPGDPEPPADPAPGDPEPGSGW